MVTIIIIIIVIIVLIIITIITIINRCVYLVYERGAWSATVIDVHDFQSTLLSAFLMNSFGFLKCRNCWRFSNVPPFSTLYLSFLNFQRYGDIRKLKFNLGKRANHWTNNCSVEYLKNQHAQLTFCIGSSFNTPIQYRDGIKFWRPRNFILFIRFSFVFWIDLSSYIDSRKKPLFFSPLRLSESD